MKYLKNSKGMSAIELIIIVLIVIAIIVVVAIKGFGLLKDSKVEDIMTDMITIKANTKVYAEEVNSKTLDEEDQDTAKVNMFESEYGMFKTELNEVEEYIESLEAEKSTDESTEESTEESTDESSYECYRISNETLNLMKVEDEEIGDYDFYVVYNADDYSDIEVIYKPGVIYNEATYYTLSDLQEVVEE